MFAIDSRTLAAFRIAVGCVLLVDLAIRATDLGTMYTDQGMFPRADVLRRYTGIWNWSFHFASGTWGYQAFLFGVSGVLGLAMLLGIGTRWVTIGSWLMAISIQNRVPPILNGGDGLLRMLLFWAMFLPIGQVWSLDAWRAKRRGSGGGDVVDSPVLSVASAAILLQMAFMYFFSAVFKTDVTWLKGDIIAGTLAHDFYAKPLGTVFLGSPLLLRGLTVGVFVLEWVGPLLLFCPRFTGGVRLAVVAMLAAMHLCIEVTLTVGMFSMVSLAGLVLFLPGRLWDRLPWARRSNSVEDGRLAPERLWKRSSGFTGAHVAQGVCLVLLLYVVVVNVNSLPGHPLSRFPTAQSSFLRTACGLGQKWNMFDEIPSKDGWYVAWAKLKDGTEIDLLRGGVPVDWNRPAYPAGTYPNHRWRKCFREMAYFDQMGYQMFRAPVASYLCRRWDARNDPGKHVREFDFVYCMESDSVAEDGGSIQVTIRERLMQVKPKRAEGEALAARGF